MSVSFTKLFSSITESTVWCEPDRTRLVWITMLAMADRRGRVWASVPGLANRARVPLEDCEAAIETFLQPDRYSRTKTTECEGRRIEKIDGGWRLINYDKYRAIRDDEAVKESKRNYINSRRKAEAESRTKNSTVEHGRTLSIQAEAEAEAEADKTKTTPAVQISKSADSDTPAGVVPPDGVKASKPGNIGALTAAALDALRVTPSVGSDQHEASGQIWAVLKANGCKGTASHPAVIEMARNGVSGDDVRRAIAEARKSNEGQLSPAYIAAIVERLKTAPNRAGKASAWATDDQALERKALELGVAAKRGETYSDLRNRVRDAVSQQARESVK